MIIVIFVAFLGIGVYFWNESKKVYQDYLIRYEALEEKINVLSEELETKKFNLILLPAKLNLIKKLDGFLNKIIQFSRSSDIRLFFVESVASMIPESENVIFFEFDANEGCLRLSESYKRNKKVVLKEKTGDIFDHWVLRHSQSLLVADLLKDFRFDFSESIAYQQRKIRSLTATPVCVGNHLLGVVRIESKTPEIFNLDHTRILRTMSDITAMMLERIHLFNQIEQLAIRDSLTGLFLRNYFHERLEREIKRCQNENTNLGLAMLDIDDFKKINDTYGHIVGDSVLVRLSQIIQKVVNEPASVICRYGGEEFVFFIPACSTQCLWEVCERLRKTVATTVIRFRKKKLNFTVSIGGVVFPEQVKDPSSLIVWADNRMYKAKKEGKNRVCIS